MCRLVCVTYFNMSMTAVSSFGIGNFACVFPCSLDSVVVEDFENAGGVGGFDVVLVRGPDQLIVFLPCDTDPLASCVRALEPQGFAQLMEDVVKFLDKSHRF